MITLLKPRLSNGFHVSTCRVIHWPALHARASLRPLRAVCFWLSTIGITLGVMALVTVLSVMNGFEKDLENNILGLMPQALVTSPQGSVNPQQLPASEVQKLQGVTRVAPLTTGDVVLQSARSVAVGVMLGVNPDEADPLTPIWSTSSSNSCSRANTTSSSANSWRGNWASSAAIRCA